MTARDHLLYIYAFIPQSVSEILLLVKLCSRKNREQKNSCSLASGSLHSGDEVRGMRGTEGLALQGSSLTGGFGKEEFSNLT